MTRRAQPYHRTPSTGRLLAAAGSCLAATILAPAVFVAAADASSGGAGGLSAAAPPSGSTPTPAASGGTAMSGTTASTTATTTPVVTATTPTVVVDPSSGATSGGTGLAGGSASQAADAIVSASGGGFTLQVHASGLTDQTLSFSGTAPSSDAGHQIVLQRAPIGDTGAATWVNAAHALIATSGDFKVGWKAAESGRFQVRAVLAGQAEPTAAAPATSTASSTTAVTTTGTAAAATSSDSPAVDVTIFKAADATFYGPGLWGRHTACGEVLRRTTLGVANRTIKCGTEITVYFNGNEITVPVIDRGPYVRGVDWDLTKATANAVGLTDQIGRGTVGTLIVNSLTTGSL
jgi:hypothetical protein